jgi:hypothetical protein
MGKEYGCNNIIESNKADHYIWLSAILMRLDVSVWISQEKPM